MFYVYVKEIGTQDYTAFEVGRTEDKIRAFEIMRKNLFHTTECFIYEEDQEIWRGTLA